MPRWFLRSAMVVALITTTLAVSCTRFDLANMGVGDFAGRTDTGVVFDAATGLALDIYRPATEGPHPVLIFWYGGSWQSGARTDYRFIGVEMARRGFVTVLPDYRKYPDVTYPGFVEDAADALVWVRDNIAAHTGNPDRIVISGHSAGAHMAVMLATDQRFLEARGLSPASISGVIGLAGPYHFTPESSTLTRVFNGPADFPAMQAGNFVDGDEPPMVLLHGDADALVGKVNIRRLTAALDSHGGCYRTRFYPEVGHTGIVGAFSWAYEAEPIVPEFAGFAHSLADGTLCGPRR